MQKSGFTVVELIITIAIMGILMTLAVVSMNASQLQARDEERKADIQAIATSLETFYNSGNNQEAAVGRYPSYNLAKVSPSTDIRPVIRNTLRDVNMEWFLPPGQTDVNNTFIAATNNVATPEGVLPQPTVSQYVYQTFDSAGNLCGNAACRRFYLYYRLESDGKVYQLASKNQ